MARSLLPLSSLHPDRLRNDGRSRLAWGPLAADYLFGARAHDALPACARPTSKTVRGSRLALPPTSPYVGLRSREWGVWGWPLLAHFESFARRHDYAP